MHPPDCPEWEYKHHALYPELPGRCAALLTDLRTGLMPVRPIPRDTRNCHSRMFSGITPENCAYYAGQYRGSLHRCLRFYECGIASDPRVGTDPGSVWADLKCLDEIITAGFEALDQAFAMPDAVLSPDEKAYYLIVFVCRILVEFMRVHPYANGNGHMGRLIVTSILGAYGIWPKKWPLNDRPPDPPYSALLSLYRDDVTEPLEKFVMHCVIG